MFLIRNYFFSQEKDKVVIWKENKGWNKSDTIIIELKSGFNDSLIIYLNNKIVYNNYCKTNESISFADEIIIRKSKVGLKNKNYIYIYRKRKGKKEKMISFYLDLRYKYISVYHLSPWHINFQNTINCCSE